MCLKSGRPIGIRHILPAPRFERERLLYSVGHSHQNVETIIYLGFELLRKPTYGARNASKSLGRLPAWSKRFTLHIRSGGVKVVVFALHCDRTLLTRYQLV